MSAKCVCCGKSTSDVCVPAKQVHRFLAPDMPRTYQGDHAWFAACDACLEAGRVTRLTPKELRHRRLLAIAARSVDNFSGVRGVQKYY